MEDLLYCGCGLRNRPEKEESKTMITEVATDVAVWGTLAVTVIVCIGRIRHLVWH